MTDLSYLKDTYRRAIYDNNNAFRSQFWVNPVYFEAGRCNLCRSDGHMPLLPRERDYMSVPLRHADKYLLSFDGGYAA